MADDKKATDGAENTKSQNQQGQDEQDKSKEKKILTLTEEEFNQKLQSEADKRVSEALKTSKQKWEKEVSEKIQKEREEAERLATMNEEERQKAIAAKREAELNERETSLKRKEMELEAVKILDEKGLPVKFARTLIGTNADTTMTNISDFEKEWNAALDKKVAERLKSKTPPADDQKSRKMDMNALIRSQARKR